MSRYLTSFPGKYGDILWSLPTVRAISQMKGEKVDFAIMPQYENLLPLLQAQPYIDKAFVMADWQLTHSNHGDQPWQPPIRIEREYQQSFHLGYRGHPGMSGQPNMSLVDFIAWQQGIRFVENPIPFISSTSGKVLDESKAGLPYVACAFNEMYGDLKARFESRFLELILGKVFPVKLNRFQWFNVPSVISGAVAYVGDRSALHVVAHGVGQKLITYEPHPARNKQGHLGIVFSCPYGQETAIPLNMSPEEAAEKTAELLKQMNEEKNYLRQLSEETKMKAEEMKNENDRAIAG